MKHRKRNPETTGFAEGAATGMMSLMKEFYQFLMQRKKLWLLPIVITLLLLGALIFFTSGSAVAPFIYTLF